MNNELIQQVNYILPQTQCRECGFSGCLPYATALVEDDAAINLCSAGGEIVMYDIANLLSKPPKLPEKIQAKQLAWIDEDICIGCTACIRACPVDAIMGARKQMHTVIADECTGCSLCVAPCPVDCIYMQDTDAIFLPQAHNFSDKTLSERLAAAQHAKMRFDNREARKLREHHERQQKIAECQAAIQHNTLPEKKVFNPTDLIAKAMAKAQSQQNQRVTETNRDAFRETQIQAAQEKATYRRYMRDAKYGDDAQKAAAIEWLRKYKEEQEAKALAER